MKHEMLFKLHVLRAVSCYKELLDEDCINGHTAAQLSSQLGISRNVLQLGFKKLYGESIREYKLRKRMERSCALLDVGKDVKVVAQELNYTKSRAFSSAFKRFYGYNPSVFCKMLE
jgi:AraC-like DNA-binding protein